MWTPTDATRWAALGKPTSNNVIMLETIETIWALDAENDGRGRCIRAGMAALKAFKPKDEIEGLLAAQAAARHVACNAQLKPIEPLNWHPTGAY